MIGQRLAHYQILEKLGSGGMGDVYKARDTRLNRTVAIKVLPPDKVANPDRKRRFIQEAQSASALNHPNIVVIHDINEEEGVDYIVMEYIDGKTLDAVIPRQGMRLAEALKNAIAIADGLAKAHAAGIIHRDIKPSNIIIAADGRVKILDFGLAKLVESSQASDAETRTQTPQTEDGVIMGTLSYMSPEQAEGAKLDARSDIFSFGAVLYEMVTGRKAFQGESRVATLSAILKDDPKPPENIPADLDKIVRRCLRKDPARRFQSMADVKVELDEIREDSESGKLTPASVAPRHSKIRWALPLALGLAGLAGIVIWLRSAPPVPVPDLELTQLTRDPGLTYQPALSADGKLLAYASDRSGEGHMDIWVQQMAGGQPVRLTSGPGDKYSPAFSPDGTKVVYSSWFDRSVATVPALGGEPVTLAKEPLTQVQYAPDGSQLAGNRAALSRSDLAIYQLAPIGGTTRKVETQIKNPRFITWSPDSKLMLLAELESAETAAPFRELYTQAQSGTANPADWMPALRARGIQLDTSTQMRWLPGRLLLGGRAGAVSVIDEFRLTGNTLSKAGGARRLLTLPGTDIGLAAADDSPIVFSKVTTITDLWSLPLTGDSAKVLGSPEKLTDDEAREVEPSLSADGKRMIFVSDRTGRSEIWLRDLLTGKDRQIMEISGQLFRARISPDGTKVAYEVRGNPGYIAAKELESGEPLIVCRDCGNPRWTPDSQRIVYFTGNPLQWYSHRFRSGDRTEVISHPRQPVQAVRFSPDGNWISFGLPVAGGVSQIFLSPIRDGKAAPESEWFSIGSPDTFSSHSWWSPNGNLIYYLKGPGGQQEIVAQPLTPATKRPSGPLRPVYRPEAGKRFVIAGSVGLSLAQNRLVFAMSESKGNLWKLSEKRPAP